MNKQKGRGESNSAGISWVGCHGMSRGLEVASAIVVLARLRGAGLGVVAGMTLVTGAAERGWWAAEVRVEPHSVARWHSTSCRHGCADRKGGWRGGWGRGGGLTLPSTCGCSTPSRLPRRTGAPVGTG